MAKQTKRLDFYLTLTKTGKTPQDHEHICDIHVKGWAYSNGSYDLESIDVKGDEETRGRLWLRLLNTTICPVLEANRRAEKYAEAFERECESRDEVVPDNGFPELRKDYVGNTALPENKEPYKAA